MNTVQNSVTGLTQYRGRTGQLSFILHRITGLGTLLFLAIHIADTSTVYFAPSLYAHAIDLYRNPFFMIGEIFLVFCLIYHGVNGLRIAIFDLFQPSGWKREGQPTNALVVLGIAVVLWLPAAVIMGSNLIKYGFGG
jgi:succinate dehydrogenase / fumarate reductase cytochrome b subunit